MTEAAERLRRRYPSSRLPRPVVIALVAALAAVSLGWLIWAATVQSRPIVAGHVSAYTVESDQKIRLTLTVDRRDPSIPVSCLVFAQAQDFESVAEQSIDVPATAAKVVDVSVELNTFRRATSASLRTCTVK